MCSDAAYDAAFTALAAALDAQEHHHVSLAINHYLNASKLFRILWKLEEADMSKRALLEREIADFEKTLQTLITDKLSTEKAQADSLVELATLQDEHRLGGGREEVTAVAETYCLAAERYIAIGAENAKSILDHVAYLKGISSSKSEISSSSSTCDKGLDNQYTPASVRMATLFGGGSAASTMTPLDLPEVPSNTPPGWLPDARSLPKASPVSPTSASLPAPPTGLAGRTLPVPTPGTGIALSSKEISVLRHSSTIDGTVFQPWLPGEELNEQFRYKQAWSDPAGKMELSTEQKHAKAVWRRPLEYLALQRHERSSKGKRDNNDPPPSTSALKWSDVEVVSQIDPYCINQTLIADCSFVCSLCITAAFEKRFQKRLITRIIFPQNSAGEPIVNPFGKYLIKLHFNGVERKVIVDDYMPTHPTTGELLCSHSIYSDKHELWVSLIEKAYMKLNGGYNFPGSNSGIDLYALTGWIPEHVRFVEDTLGSARDRGKVASDLQTEDRAWRRLHSAHKFGDCLITIATPGELSDTAQQATGLVDGHAYAVLDVVEAGRLRMLRVKNPWARRPWIGRFSSQDQQAWTAGLRRALGVRPAGDGGEDDFKKMERAGIFWIEFSDCRKYFDSFVLSWNPKLFPFRIKLHDTWPVTQGPRKDTYFVGENPQFSLLIDRPMPSADAVGTSSGNHRRGSGPIQTSSSLTVSVWVLITRHIIDTKAEAGTDVPDQSGPDDSRMLALHVHRGTNGRRIYSPAKPFIQGVYTDNPHVLTRFDVEFSDFMSATGDELASGTVSHTLVMSQLDKTKSHSYSLEVLATGPFRLAQARPPPGNSKTFTGSWTAHTSGGPPSGANYYKNPQYSVRIRSHNAAPVAVLLEAWYPLGVSAHLALVRASTATARGASATKIASINRIDVMTEDTLVMEASAYTEGYTHAYQEKVPPGDYVLVLSTWRSSMEGSYRLRLSCSDPAVTLEALRPEGAGMHCHTLRGRWAAGGTAAGSGNHGAYMSNPKHFFSIDSEQCTFGARLTLSSPNKTALNVSLYKVPDPRFPLDEQQQKQDLTPRRALASSCQGRYTQAPSGVSIPTTLVLGAGTYVIVPSTFDPIPLAYSLTVFCSDAAPLQSLNLVE